MKAIDEMNGAVGAVSTGAAGVETAKPETEKKEVKDVKDVKAMTTAVPAKPKEAAKGKKAPDNSMTFKARMAVKARQVENAKGKKAKASAKTAKPVKSAKAAKPATVIKPVKAAKPPKTVKAARDGKPENADGNPYRPTSSYGKLWAILLKHKNGITRSDLIKEGAKVTGKPEKNTGFDVAVVASPSQDGKAHPSANRAADSYWVERSEGGLLKLHLR